MVYTTEPTARMLFSVLREDRAVQDFLGELGEHHKGTAHHSERVSLYTLDLYVQRYMTTKSGVVIINQENIREGLRWGYAGIYHDAGKLLIEQEILAKPEQLSEAEREKMKRHPLFGLALIANYTRDDAVLKAAVGHHEYKQVGSYPRLRRRNDDEIVEAVALADFYDALASRREYKPAFEPPVIKKILHEEFAGNSLFVDTLLKRTL